MSKILEKVIEPSIVYTGSIFKLKIKIQETKYYSYSDYTEKKYSELESLTYSEVKGG